MLSLGLYIHVPFCRQLCHYCDFAKTANFNPDIEFRYWQWLDENLDYWLHFFYVHNIEIEFPTVFLGGGTPSLYTQQWLPIFEKIRPYMSSQCEVTIEANPDDIKEKNLQFWKSIGMNRMSMGIQSFQEHGLKFLTRVHTAKESIESIQSAIEVFPNLNIDLIYGWPDQTQQDWVDDLRTAVDLNVKHLSLYNLTYEKSTTIGRRYHRGKILGHDEKSLENLYINACNWLADYGYIHQEVSNWSQEKHESQHNWLYWTDRPYLGLGPGAHSYLKSDDWPWGHRFSFSNRFPSMLKQKREICYDDINSFILSLGVAWESDRDCESWLLETIGCGLRCRKGVSIQELSKRTNRTFNPRPLVKEALTKGWLQLSSAGQLTLIPSEWFRETAWSLEVALSLVPQIRT